MILILDRDIDLTPMRDAWHGSLRAVGLDGTGQGWDVRNADQILVLEDGEIRERGDHEELLASGGRYAQLFDLQARGYR